MRKPVNLLTDTDPSSLAADLKAMEQYRRARSAEADFDSYLDFLEETSSLFGFARKESPNSLDIPDSDQIALIL